MKLADSTTQKIITQLLHGQDYHNEVSALIHALFLEYAIDFFRRIVDAKLKNQAVTTDWYKAEFLDPKLPSGQLIIHSGSNKKSISNMYNSARREVVLDATEKNYAELYAMINNLVREADDLDVTLTIKFRGVSVDLLSTRV